MVQSIVQRQFGYCACIYLLVLGMSFFVRGFQMISYDCTRHLLHMNYIYITLKTAGDISESQLRRRLNKSENS